MISFRSLTSSTQGRAFHQKIKGLTILNHLRLLLRSLRIHLALDFHHLAIRHTPFSIFSHPVFIKETWKKQYQWKNPGCSNMFKYTTLLDLSILCAPEALTRTLRYIASTWKNESKGQGALAIVISCYRLLMANITIENGHLKLNNPLNRVFEELRNMMINPGILGYFQINPCTVRGWSTKWTLTRSS